MALGTKAMRTHEFQEQSRWRMSRVTVPTEAQTLFEITREEILRSGGELQMLSDVARQALEAADNPDCVIADVAGLVERDTRLTAEVLTMANSVAYASPVPIVSLHQAIARLGLQSCKNLILTTSIASMMRKMSLEVEWVREQLWRHSFTTALLSLNLNRQLRCGFQGEEFTAGLIHDIGRTLFASHVPDRFAMFDPLTFDEADDALSLEVEIAGASHCDLGAWFLRHNRLPDPLVAVVQHHHEPEAAPHDQRLVALVAAADHMANHLQRSLGVEEYELAANPALPALARACPRQAMTGLDEICRRIMQTVSEDGQLSSVC